MAANNARGMFTFDPGEMPSGSALYGDKAKVAIMFKSLNSPATTAPGEDLSSVRGHTRRQYPGDGTKISVVGHDRQRLTGAFTSGLATLPGEPFTIEVPPTIPGGKTKVTQFTLKGPFTRFYKLYLAKYRSIAVAHVIRSPGGKPYAVDASGPGA
jgi:hypothetical protein